MAFIRVRATIQGVSGLPGLMTTYWSGTATPPAVADVNDATGRVRSFWVALVAQLAAGATVSVQQTADYIDPTTGQLLGRVSAASAPALVTSTGTQELPPATALGIRFTSTTVINRRIVQGRSFVSPLALAANTNGLPSAGALSAATTACAALFSGATSIVPTIWHRPTPGGSNGASVVATAAAPDPTKLWVLRSRRD
jgi:hypothetical protein